MIIIIKGMAKISMPMKDRLSMLSFVKDLPNIISLLGLLSAVIGVFFAVKQVY